MQTNSWVLAKECIDIKDVKLLTMILDSSQRNVHLVVIEMKSFSKDILI
jgi:hypothetical protein